MGFLGIGGVRMRIELRFSNWEKFQPRKDVKHPWWFAISNKIYRDELWDELPGDLFKAFYFLLAHTSETNPETGELKTTTAVLSRLSGLPLEVIRDTLGVLENHGVIQYLSGASEPRTEPVQ